MIDRGARSARLGDGYYRGSADGSRNNAWLLGGPGRLEEWPAIRVWVNPTAGNLRRREVFEHYTKRREGSLATRSFIRLWPLELPSLCSRSISVIGPA